MIDLRNHYGFTRTPFGKDLAPSMLHHYPGHAEAVAGSPGPPASAPWASSPAKSAQVRRPQPAPPSPAWTRPGTP